jgi:hypothetical protein
MDVHGAGSQRSDPKTGDASQFPYGRGPQGDVIRIENMVRCIRGGKVKEVDKGARSSRQSHSSSSSVTAVREPAQQNRFMDREDRNGDGKASRDEFRGPSDHFDHLDKNGDGFITEDEAPHRPPPQKR